MGPARAYAYPKNVFVCSLLSCGVRMCSLVINNINVTLLLLTQHTIIRTLPTHSCTHPQMTLTARNKWYKQPCKIAPVLRESNIILRTTLKEFIIKVHVTKISYSLACLD